MEKLYNNIILEDNFLDSPSDAQNVPYLKNPPEVINITAGRQLFVDDFLIEKTDLEPEYHTAHKYEGNPVLKAEMPWEKEPSPVACPKSGGVWYDEEDNKFKMWYEAGWLHNMCYAESSDGVNWIRSNIENDTNKILTYEGYEPEKTDNGLEYLRPDSTAVFIDYNAPKEEKYKMFLRNPNDPRKFAIVAVSGDGIHFDRFRYTSTVGDRSTIFYNPFRKKWVYSIRAEWNCRSRSYRECNDFLDGAVWNGAEEHKWMSCDEFDLPNPYIGMKPELYNVDCVGYESIMLGMFQIMYGPVNEKCENSGVPKITELMPMYSRDGYNFSRPCRKSIISASMYEGAWDRGYIQSVGGVCVVKEEEIWIYYIGFAGDENYSNKSWLSENGMYRNGATGIAKLRRDGFVSMNGRGTLFTKKLECEGKTKMFINADGEVSAEIFDSEGNIVAKSNVFKGDSTKAELHFNNFDIKELNEMVFRIKFYVDGKLYSFGFTDDSDDFGGAHAAGFAE